MGVGSIDRIVLERTAIRDRRQVVAFLDATVIATRASATVSGPMAGTIAWFAAVGRIADHFTPVGAAATSGRTRCRNRTGPRSTARDGSRNWFGSNCRMRRRTHRNCCKRCNCCIRRRHRHGCARDRGDEPGRRWGRSRPRSDRSFGSRNRRRARIRSTRTTTTEFHNSGLSSHFVPRIG